MWFWIVFFSTNWTTFYSVAGIEIFLAGLLPSHKISFPVTHDIIPLNSFLKENSTPWVLQLWVLKYRQKWIPCSSLCSFWFCCLTPDFAYLVNFLLMFSFRILFSLEFLTCIRRVLDVYLTLIFSGCHAGIVFLCKHEARSACATNLILSKYKLLKQIFSFSC